MKMLLTGANGFVGNRIKNTYGEDVVASPSLRNVSEDDVKRIVEESGADVIVHTAAISDIGVCQNNPQQSYIANVMLPVYLAKAAQGRKLVCFSSDQVYSGCEADGPYTEENVRPANIYAEHKLEMEKRVLDIAPDAVMLRAEWMYDVVSTRGNYIRNVLDGYLTYSSQQTFTFHTHSAFTLVSQQSTARELVLSFQLVTVLRLCLEFSLVLLLSVTQMISTTQLLQAITFLQLLSQLVKTHSLLKLVNNLNKINIL